METNDPFNFQEGKTEEEANLIEKLEKKLYSRTEKIKHKDRTKLNPKKFGALEDWEEGGELSYKKTVEAPQVSGYVKFFLFSVAFFAVAALIAGYSFLSKRSVISPDNVGLLLSGPVSIKGGEELPLEISIENKNEVPLSNIEVLVNFPKGTRYPNNTGKEMLRYTKSITGMKAKEVRLDTVKAILLGEENQRKDMTVTVKFRIEGLGSSYTKTRNYSVNLTSSPLSIKTEVLKEVISGQGIVLGVDVKSLSPSLLKNPIIEITYPKGFIFKSASPAPTAGDNFWNIGDMNFGDERHFDITGSLMGENDQKRVFILSAGVPTEKDSTSIDTRLASLSQGIIIKKPFLGVDLFLNGTAETEYVLSVGNNVEVGARWVNNLPGKITDGQITISLNGDMVDKKRVSPKGNGFYDSAKNTVYWDSKMTSSLVAIESGGESNTGLTFGLLPFLKSDGTIFKNPVIMVGASVKGYRLSEKNVPEEINSFVESKVKVGTIPKVAPSIMFRVGPFENDGPLPFRVGQETTATLVWKVSNSVNDISNARITAVLPSYVRWTGKVSPEGANISYNSISGEVRWNIGTVKAGTGYENEPIEVAFQIGVTPGLSQVEQLPVLISSGRFTGKDDFTSVMIGQNIITSSGYSAGEPGYNREWTVVRE